jgi:hypothetical protein
VKEMCEEWNMPEFDKKIVEDLFMIANYEDEDFLNS